MRSRQWISTPPSGIMRRFATQSRLPEVQNTRYQSSVLARERHSHSKISRCTLTVMLVSRLTYVCGVSVRRSSCKLHAGSCRLEAISCHMSRISNQKKKKKEPEHHSRSSHRLRKSPPTCAGKTKPAVVAQWSCGLIELGPGILPQSEV